MSSNFDELKKTLTGLDGVDESEKSFSWGENTRLVHGYHGFDERTGAPGVPIYPSTLFAHPKFGESTGFAYSRCGNPTRLELENTLAMLEHGLKAWAFSSGMAAVSTLLKLFKPNDHILVSDDLYGGTYRLFTEIYSRFGLEFSFADTTNIEKTKAALRPNTKALFIETPSNPMMKVTDIKAAANLVHEVGGLLIVDNTFLSPYFQKPLDFGADIVVHSGTKYIGGHNDVMSGFIVVREEALIEPIFMLSMSEGGMLSPFDSWLTLRSLKTLSVRLERQQQNAIDIVEFLKKHKNVEAVYYAGDPDHPDFELSKKQTSGFGGMVSFRLGGGVSAAEVLDRLKLILYAESLGGTETLMTYPLVQTHSAIPEEIRNRLGVDERLLRLSVGIEDVNDLISDLEQALK